MLMLYRLIHLVFAAYALGLMAYTILSWVRDRKFETARRWLEPFYLPFLAPLRAAIGTVRVGASHLDLAPLALLAGIVVTRALVVYLLFGRV